MPLAQSINLDSEPKQENESSQISAELDAENLHNFTALDHRGGKGGAFAHVHSIDSIYAQSELVVAQSTT